MLISLCGPLISGKISTGNIYLFDFVANANHNLTNPHNFRQTFGLCVRPNHTGQGRIIQPESSCIVYYTYYIILCIILCIIFTYDFKTIRPKSNSIIHNTQYNTYYVLIRIMYCHTLLRLRVGQDVGEDAGRGDRPILASCCSLRKQPRGLSVLVCLCPRRRGGQLGEVCGSLQL